MRITGGAAGKNGPGPGGLWVLWGHEAGSIHHKEVLATAVEIALHIHCQGKLLGGPFTAGTLGRGYTCAAKAAHVRRQPQLAPNPLHAGIQTRVVGMNGAPRIFAVGNVTGGV